MEDIIIQIFPTEILAELARTELEAYGIKSVTEQVGFSGGTHGGISLGRTALRVLEKDVEKAKELLNIK